jgi:hypothetical protein
MDELLKTLILQAPNFIGFVALAVVLSRMIEKQTAMIERLIEKLECDDGVAIGQKETD